MANFKTTSATIFLLLLPSTAYLKSLNAEDMINLMVAMHGAASQQPENAPKDKYGNPYIIGDLGGVPVNLPSSVVQFVEYDDSPGWDMEKLKNYRPAERNYQSKIISFGFDFRNPDGLLHDSKNPESVKAFKDAKKFKRGKIDRNYQDNWVRVSVSHYGSNENALTNYTRWIINPYDDQKIDYYSKVGGKYYGLNYYYLLGINPQTGNFFREEIALVEDVYINESLDGKVLSLIRCSVNNVPSPPCTHDFEFPAFMKIRVSLSYSRHNLKYWKQIEQKVVDIISSYII